MDIKPNPYTPSNEPANAGVCEQPADLAARLRRISLYQTWLFRLAFAQLPLFLFSLVTRAGGSPFEQALPMLIYCVLAALIGIFVFLLALETYPAPIGALIGLPLAAFAAMPCSGLFGIAFIYQQSSMTLHNYGVFIGVLGPTRESVEERIEEMEKGIDFDAEG